MFRNKPFISAVILLLLIAGSFLGYSLALPEALAQGGYGLEEAGEEAGLPQETNIGALVGKILRYVLGLLGIILVVIIIIGGFMWMTSAGNPEKVQKAKAIITNGIIGLVIIVFSYIIANFIIERFIEAGQSTP